MRSKNIIWTTLAVLAAACGRNGIVGTRTDALDQASWEAAEWISAADAPVLTGIVNNRENYRAADGARPAKGRFRP